MKIFILTSVGLFSDYGDLDSLNEPSVFVTPFPSLELAREKMNEEVESELNEAKENYDEDQICVEKYPDNATFETGEPGNGCSWSRVTWEIKEIEM